MSLRELVPILQFAIAPVILISGVGLLLLSTTNRFGRVIDRARKLTNELRNETTNRKTALAELGILLRRARIIRAAIAFFIFSVLFTAVMIIVLFVTAVFQLGFAAVITGLFIGSMLFLIAALSLFIADINLSLTALKLEVSDIEVTADTESLTPH